VNVVHTLLNEVIRRQNKSELSHSLSYLNYYSSTSHIRVVEELVSFDSTVLFVSTGSWTM